MPPRSRGGGGLSARGGQAPGLSVQFRVEGVDKTQAEFKAVRRDINQTMRDAQAKVGEREVLPLIKARFPVAGGDDQGRGLPRGAMRDSLYIKRDRLDVVVGSRLRGAENRALGWIDFGGQRNQDSQPRKGTRVIVGTLDAAQPRIRAGLQDALLDEFRRHGFEVD